MRFGIEEDAVFQALPRNWSGQWTVEHGEVEAGYGVAVQQVRQELETLKTQIAELRQRQVLRILVTTFTPDPFEVLRPFEVIVEPCDGEYVASFYDGNINASGDTPTEAYANLKDMIIGTYELFVDMDEEELGPEPLRQLAVLREVMRER